MTQKWHLAKKGWVPLLYSIYSYYGFTAGWSRPVVPEPNLVPWAKIFVYILYWAIFSSHIIWFFGQNSLDTPVLRYMYSTFSTLYCIYSAITFSVFEGYESSLRERGVTHSSWTLDPIGIFYISFTRVSCIRVLAAIIVVYQLSYIFLVYVFLCTNKCFIFQCMYFRVSIYVFIFHVIDRVFLCIDVKAYWVQYIVTQFAI